MSHSQWTKINVDILRYLPIIPITADIGEDGDLYILISRISVEDFINSLQGSVDGQILLYEGPSLTKHIIEDDSSWISKVIELNDDNRVDIVAGNMNAGEVVWYEAPNWTRHVIDTLKRAGGVDVAELDNDKELDIVAS